MKTSIIGLCMALAAGVVSAQQKTEPASASPIMTTKQRCEERVREFNAADVTSIEATKLAAAKEQATRGGNLCNTDPTEGVRLLEMAFKDIGVTPK